MSDQAELAKCWCGLKLHWITYGDRDFLECPLHGTAYKEDAEAVIQKSEILADFDRLASTALHHLRDTLAANGPIIVALARARLVQGFDTYPDGPMFTWGTNRLTEETLEELADAEVYKVFGLLLAERDQPS